MSLETELFARLSGFAGLTALVGQRIYPIRAVQNTLKPYMVYNRISSVRPSAFGQDTGLLQARIQLDSWADVPTGETKGADKVAEQIRAALQRWSGGNIHHIFMDNQFDGWDEDARLFRNITDVLVWYREG